LSDVARLVVPALRWRRNGGFAHETAAIDRTLAAGVGGFCIFGGTVSDVRELTAELTRRSARPILFASDLERGAGQQLDGATQLPPLAAIGSLDDTAITRRAGEITGREALACGIDWVYAPVADVDVEPRNPIVGTRSFGSDPDRVAAHVAAWIAGCRAAGALCCAKHFPGHGRTTEDSHAALPRVPHDRAALELDLKPFRAAIGAGVDSMMSAHVVYDALDPDTAATLSPRVLVQLARRELGFTGLMVSDALNMAGVRAAAGGSEGAAAVAALAAGCDGLLYPDDLAAVIAALASAPAAILRPARIGEALQRFAGAAQRVHARARHAAVVGGENQAWADRIAEDSLATLRGTPVLAGHADVVIIDDDTGGPYPAPDRAPFTEELRRRGVQCAGERSVVAVFSDVRAWKGAPGLRAPARTALAAALERDPHAVAVLFGHPALARDIPARHILCAWGGEAVMQRAAARRLASTAAP
jgi:beta-glucosidase-like glycosyl hydrolase